MRNRTITISEEHQKLINNHCLNLSKFIRKKLDEYFEINSSIQKDDVVVPEEKIQ
jgi:hypothetical protein